MKTIAIIVLTVALIMGVIAGGAAIGNATYGHIAESLSATK